MLLMPLAQPTTTTRANSAGWTVLIGAGIGGAAVGLIWATLSALDPTSDAAWLVPMIGLPIGLTAVAAVPGQGRLLRLGMALGALMVMTVCIGYAVASIPYA